MTPEAGEEEIPQGKYQPHYTARFVYRAQFPHQQAGVHGDQISWGDQVSRDRIGAEEASPISAYLPTRPAPPTRAPRFQGVEESPGGFTINYQPPAWYKQDSHPDFPVVWYQSPPLLPGGGDAFDPSPGDDADATATATATTPAPPRPAPTAVRVPTPAPPRPSRATGFAARLAGADRSHLRDEWGAVLVGLDDAGVPPGRQAFHVAGFLAAAVRMRAADLSRPLWRPVDWVLAEDSRAHSLIALLVGGLALYYQAHGGLYVLVTEGSGPCTLLATVLLWGKGRLRVIRGVELAGDDEDPPPLA
ncbi:hypothetical protein [Streptomyces sp. NPDC054784]